MAIDENTVKSIVEDYSSIYLAVEDIIEKDITTSMRNAIKNHLLKMVYEHGAISILSKDATFFIKDLFVPQSFKLSSGEITDQNRQEKFLSRKISESGCNLDELLEYQSLYIFGPPGSGKSLLLKNLMLESYHDRKPYLFPVYINIRKWADENESSKSMKLDEYIVNILERRDFFKDCKSFVLNMLQKGRCILLLDGMDELRIDDSENIHNKINSFSNIFCTGDIKNKIIVSSRSEMLNGALNNFKSYRLLPFDDKQVEVFIRKFFGPRHTISITNIIELLKDEDNAAIMEVARNPLILTLMCMVYERHQAFSSRRSGLFFDAIRAYTKDSNLNSKDLFKIFKMLDSRERDDVISEIAYQWFCKDHFFWEEEDVVSFIKKNISENATIKDIFKNDDGELTRLSKDILNYFDLVQGVITKRNKNEYTFTHLSFQEYFAARRVVRRFDDSIKDINNKFTDERWYEIFLLACEIFANAEYFIKFMIDSVNNEIRDNNKIKELLEHQNKKTLLVFEDINDNNKILNNENKPKIIAETRAFYLALNNIITERLYSYSNIHTTNNGEDFQKLKKYSIDIFKVYLHGKKYLHEKSNALILKVEEKPGELETTINKIMASTALLSNNFNLDLYLVWIFILVNEWIKNNQINNNKVPDERRDRISVNMGYLNAIRKAFTEAISLSKSICKVKSIQRSLFLDSDLSELILHNVMKEDKCDKVFFSDKITSKDMLKKYLDKYNVKNKNNFLDIFENEYLLKKEQNLTACLEKYYDIFQKEINSTNHSLQHNSSWPNEYWEVVKTKRHIGMEFELKLDELKIYKHYLFGKKLIIDCLTGAGYIKSEVREKLKETLLDIP